MIRASVIIPAHNEASVIGRALAPLVQRDDLEIIVVCNGCTDGTTDVVRAIGSTVRVMETETMSKVHAMNLGDDVATVFPRIYLDADIELPSVTIDALIDELTTGRHLAAAPRFQMDLTGCSWAVRAFYDINGRLPSAREGIGGSGVYALSKTGRARFDRFPNVTSDDGFVRLQFRPDERITLCDHVSIVHAPKTLDGLIKIKTRSHFGTTELQRCYPRLTRHLAHNNPRGLLRLGLNPLRWPALVCYVCVKLWVRRRSKHLTRAGRKLVWERDESARHPR